MSVGALYRNAVIFKVSSFASSNNMIGQNVDKCMSELDRASCTVAATWPIRNVSMVFGIWYFSMVFLQHQQKNRQERSFSIPRGQFVACFIGCRAKKQWIKFDKKCKSFKQTPPFYVFQSIFATSAKKQQERLFNIPRRQFVACFVVCRAKSNG